MKVTASAPGKINLQLLVGAPDQRGYHPLQSIFETVNLRETCIAEFTGAQQTPPEMPYVTENRFAATDSGQVIAVRTSVDFGDPTANLETVQRLNDVPAEKHLAWRAAAKLVDLAAASGTLNPNPDQWIQLTINKRIPMAGGMAGGSADAAASLVAVNELLGLQLTEKQLEVIGRTLGADVPACLTGGISLGLGYGDHMTRLDNHPLRDDNRATHPLREENLAAPLLPEENLAAPAQHHWLLLMFATGLSTPTVFHAFDAGAKGRKDIPPAENAAALLNSTPHLWEALKPATQMALLMENDLQETAFTLRPDVAQTYADVQQLHPVKVMLSGSGPTLAVLVENEDQANALGKKISENPGVQAVLKTSGPAHPARVETTESE